MLALFKCMSAHVLFNKKTNYIFLRLSEMCACLLILNSRFWNTIQGKSLNSQLFYSQIYTPFILRIQVKTTTLLGTNAQNNICVAVGAVMFSNENQSNVSIIAGMESGSGLAVTAKTYCVQLLNQISCGLLDFICAFILLHSYIPPKKTNIPQKQKERVSVSEKCK